ncbi:MAG TPA: hypothetical protein DCZ12_18910 [Gammaproteobacteria bacterium]|nr:hypothetical protein [Gammaproteobacteria bacterium]
MNIKKEIVLGILCGLLVTCIWSGWTVFSRFGVKSTLNAFDITAIRFAVAGMVMLPVFLRHRFMGLSFKQICLMAIGTGAPYSLIAVSGMHFAPASHAALFINGTLPVFTMLVAYLWLKQRAQLSQIQGTFLIIAGCTAIAWEGLHYNITGQWLGHLLFICASFILSSYLVASNHWGVTGRQAMTIGPVISLFVYVPLWFVFCDTQVWELPPAELLFHGVYQGIIVSLISLWLFTKAASLLGATTTAVFMAAVPTVSLLMSMPVLGEYPTLMNIAGVFITTLGILIASGLGLFWFQRIKLMVH